MCARSWGNLNGGVKTPGAAQSEMARRGRALGYTAIRKCIARLAIGGAPESIAVVGRERGRKYGNHVDVGEVAKEVKDARAANPDNTEQLHPILAKKYGVGRTSIGRIVMSAGLKPLKKVKRQATQGKKSGAKAGNSPKNRKLG